MGESEFDCIVFGGGTGGYVAAIRITETAFDTLPAGRAPSLGLSLEDFSRADQRSGVDGDESGNLIDQFFWDRGVPSMVSARWAAQGVG